MKFVKMHGCANDYIYVNGFETHVADPARIAVAIADRRRGVGADGLILIQPSERADAFMDIYNADGSRAEMCGNGIRCVAKFLFDRGLVRRPELRIDTLAGVKEVVLQVRGDRAVGATVAMGVPVVERAEELVAGDRTFTVHPVSIGNPHGVIFLPEVDAFPLATYGPRIERHPRFPRGTNVEIVAVLDRQHLRQRTWERGSGETLACGTGATAVAVAAIASGRAKSPVTVALAGGELVIAWEGDGRPALMTGPAVEVCTGEWLAPAAGITGS